MERILNKRTVRGKKKFLVRWKGYTAGENTWENRENLENAKELVEEFKREHVEEVEELRQQEQEEKEKEFSRELPREFTANIDGVQFIAQFFWAQYTVYIIGDQPRAYCPPFSFAGSCGVSTTLPLCLSQQFLAIWPHFPHM